MDSYLSRHEIVMSTSNNGLRWSPCRLIMQGASVPEIVGLDDESLRLYYVSSKTGEIGCSRSYDGLLWFNEPLELASSLSLPVDPAVTRLSDGRFRMYYACFPHSKLYSAISEDGLRWKEEAGSRIQSRGASNPDPVRVGSGWRMYYSVGFQIFSAISKDGLKFAHEEGIRIDRGMASSTIQLHDGRLRMYYTTLKRDTRKIKTDTDILMTAVHSVVRSAISEDGLSWQKEIGVRVSQISRKIEAPSVSTRMRQGFIGFFKRAPISTRQAKESQVGDILKIQ